MYNLQPLALQAIARHDDNFRIICLNAVYVPLFKSMLQRVLRLVLFFLLISPSKSSIRFSALVHLRECLSLASAECAIEFDYETLRIHFELNYTQDPSSFSRAPCKCHTLTYERGGRAERGFPTQDWVETIESAPSCLWLCLFLDVAACE